MKLIRELFGNATVWIIVSTIVVVLSLRADYGSPAWLWFQRSGSFVAIAGAVLTYRSIVRLGLSGVGGANTTIVQAKIDEIDDSGPVQKVRVSYDQETKEYLRQDAMDKLAGLLGVALLLIGTLV